MPPDEAWGPGKAETALKTLPTMTLLPVDVFSDELLSWPGNRDIKSHGLNAVVIKLLLLSHSCRASPSPGQPFRK